MISELAASANGAPDQAAEAHPCNDRHDAPKRQSFHDQNHAQSPCSSPPVSFRGEGMLNGTGPTRQAGCLSSRLGSIASERTAL